MKSILLTMGFLSSIFGFGQTNKSEKEDSLVEEKFSIVETKLKDGRPAVGSFNMGYKDYKLKNKYPWCLKIMIGLNLENLYENGLPKNEESSVANKFENELFNEVKKIATAHNIGHLFNDTFLDIYIYLDNPEAVHKYLQAQVNKEGLVRGFGYEIKQDPGWKAVDIFLK